MYITQNIYQPARLSMARLAEEFNMAPAYISIFFKRHTGESLKQYITRHRIKLIEARLLYSSLNLGEIAHEFGYADRLSEGPRAASAVAQWAVVVFDHDGEGTPGPGCLHHVGRSLSKRAPKARFRHGRDPPAPIGIRVTREHREERGDRVGAIARRQGREFIDAHVSHMASPYVLTSDVERDAIERTARASERTSKLRFPRAWLKGSDDFSFSGLKTAVRYELVGPGRQDFTQLQLDSGMVGLNRPVVSDPAAPFGGTKQSGLGREGGHEGMLDYTETKYIATDW